MGRHGVAGTAIAAAAMIRGKERESLFCFILLFLDRRKERKWEEGETGGWIFGFKSWLAGYLISAHLSYSRPGSGRNGGGLVCECDFESRRRKREKRRKGRGGEKKDKNYISLIYEYPIKELA